MSTMISLSNEMKPMTMAEVREKCPYAFATTPTNPGVSGKYIHANTETVINDMAKLGWYPVEAKQCRKKKSREGLRHLLLHCSHISICCLAIISIYCITNISI